MALPASIPTWTASAAGDEYRIRWSGADWTLRPGGETPGLQFGNAGPVLAVSGLAMRGRADSHAIGARSLVHCELRRRRVEARYAPADWPELTLQASWFPVSPSVVALEVEVLTRSVGQIRDFEVCITSRLGLDARSTGRESAVEARDARCAVLADDGREAGNAPAPGAAVIGRFPPIFFDSPVIEARRYAELAHAEDVSRRILRCTSQELILQTMMFGYDLERGVVLRGRARGCWLPSATAVEAADRELAEFLAEPPPLTT